MKILFYATYPKQSNGYAKIANRITNFLASQKNIELYYFGISANDTVVDRYVHPNIKLINVVKESPSQDPFGNDLISKKIEEIEPDIVFLYNDILVLSQIINKIHQIKQERNFKIYTYIDLVYEFEKANLILFINESTDKFFVFSDCWKKHLELIRISASKIFILKHGVDHSIFFKIEQKNARIEFGLSPDDFVILNLNRNTHRKSIDLTIQAFLIFLSRHPNDSRIKLLLNGAIENSSYPNLEIIGIECLRLGLDFHKIVDQNIILNACVLPDEKINLLYNACDVGINTCWGEGFGLCNLEHASVGKAQVVSKVGAFKDIFDEEHAKLIEPVTRIYSPNVLDSAGGYMEICNAKDFADALDFYYMNKEKRLSDGEYYINNLSLNYNWNSMLQEFYDNHIKF